jgi:hypothetical protein
VIFTFLAYIIQTPDMSGRALNQTLTLMVQRTYATMTNDALISIPLFVFMGYLVERANLIEKLFKSLHLALARLPGSLAIATLVTCTIFATATGIVGAVVTLMGLLAMPAMIKAGYSVRLTAGVITAGGCLGSAFDRVWCDNRHLGGSSVCRRAIAGYRSRDAICDLCDAGGQNLARYGAAFVSEGSGDSAPRRLSSHQVSRFYVGDNGVAVEFF